MPNILLIPCIAQAFKFIQNKVHVALKSVLKATPVLLTHANFVNTFIFLLRLTYCFLFIE